MTVLVVRLVDMDELSQLNHRFQNFAEDVFRRLRDKQWGRVDLAEVDRGLGCFTVAGVTGQHVRRVVRWIEEESARQHLKVLVEPEVSA